MRDGGGFVLPNPPPLPSLAQNTRRRGGSSFQPPLFPSLARNTRRRGFRPSQPTTAPLPHSKRETEGSFFLPTTTVPLPRSKRETEGVSSFPTHHRSPSLLEAQDRRGLFLPNPPPLPSLARNARRRGFPPSQPTTAPLPRSKREAEGIFLLPTRYHRIARQSGRCPSSPPPPPPSLEKRDGGVCLLPTTHPSPAFTRNTRWRGLCFQLNIEKMPRWAWFQCSAFIHYPVRHIPTRQTSKKCPPGHNFDAWRASTTSLPAGHRSHAQMRMFSACLHHHLPNLEIIAIWARF